MRRGERLQPDGSAHTAGGRNGDHVDVVVADEGRGIAIEDQSRIFEPGFRIDRTENGVGIGLHLVRRLVSDLGGHIDAG